MSNKCKNIFFNGNHVCSFTSDPFTGNRKVPNEKDIFYYKLKKIIQNNR